jgi:CPA2 family monovalent cation:H+ antiporter-2
MEITLINDLLIILAVSILIILLGHRLHIPPVVGFILTGMLAGPHALGLISQTEDVEHLAELGIVLLMFGIGMEFSLKKLVQIRRLFLIGGSIQVGVTVVLAAAIASLWDKPWCESFFIGCLVSMSSTAIIFRILESNGTSLTPHGRLSISILIFQDMIAIPMILLTPLLGKNSGGGNEFSIILNLVKELAIVAIVFLSAQKIVPRLLLLVARTRNKELFLLCVLTLCFAVAGLTSSIGLSLTIGAFLAGVIISESEFSNEAISNVFPFQALFISFFFISVGMLLDLEFALGNAPQILLFTTLALSVKLVSASLAAIVLGFPIRVALLVGFTLCQIGEFSFVLAKAGSANELTTDYSYQLFLSVALLSMIISPILISLAPRFAAWFAKLPLPNILLQGFYPPAQEEVRQLENHIIIIGFGISGQNLARVSKLAGIPYLVLEMNPDTVRQEKKKGEPIQYGDATHLSILEHLNILQARAVAIMINDPVAARCIVKVAREANPLLYIIVRTRYVVEMPLMLKLGADEVIPDEFGSSVEIFSRVLNQYHIPEAEINAFIHDIRSDGYELFRNKNPVSTKLADIKLNLANVEISSFRLQESSFLVGKKLSESCLRTTYGMNVLLINRGGSIVPNPSPDTIFQSGDVVVVVGKKVPTAETDEIFGSLKPSPTA